MNISLNDVQIGPADAANMYLNTDLIFPRRRKRNLLEM
jgi:hypothetical protein